MYSMRPNLKNSDTLITHFPQTSARLDRERSRAAASLAREAAISPNATVRPIPIPIVQGMPPRDRFLVPCALESWEEQMVQ